VPLTAVLADIGSLTLVRKHRLVMEPQFDWETIKIGAGAPPLLLAFGLFFVYHAVCERDGVRHYCAGIAVLDRDDPRKVLYRAPQPVLVPSKTYEETGAVPEVVFPTALRTLSNGRAADLFYGGADRVIAAARLPLPAKLPNVASAS
jgi:predicted GH43/DUF377 family glycosyl hydrolase